MIRSKNLSLTVLAAALGMILAGCSSSPKTPEAEVAVKNQASKYTTFGNSYFNKADYEMALRFFELALQENHSVDNLPGIAKSHNSIGKVYAAVGNGDAAAENYRLAFSFATLANDNEQKAHALINQGELALQNGKNEEANARFDEAQRMVEQETVSETPILYHNLGTMYARQGDLARARENLVRAREINESEGNWAELASNYYMLSSLASREDNYEDAMELANQALANDKRAENSPGIAADLEALGKISSKMGNDEDAYQYFLRALRVYLTLNLVRQTVGMLDNLIAVSGRMGKESEAAEFTGQRERIVTALQSAAEAKQ